MAVFNPGERVVVVHWRNKTPLKAATIIKQDDENNADAEIAKVVVINVFNNYSTVLIKRYIE